MKEIALKALSWGPLYPAGDVDFPVCAEREKRLDHNKDVPALCKAAGIQPGDVVIDVGGFVGDTAVAFAAAGARVLMFEPFLDSFVCALYNTQGLSVKCVNSPVGNGERVKFVYECPGPNYGMRRMKVVGPGETADAEAIKLDRCMEELIRKHTIKLIKIDCEGFEIPVLRGAKALLSEHDDRPFLYVEHYVDGQRNCGFTPQELVDTINGLGYSLEMWGSPPRWDWFCIPNEKLEETKLGQ